MDSFSLISRYAELSNEFVFSAALLLEAIESDGIDSEGIFNTRPLYHLLGHSLECLLKALVVEKTNCSEMDLKKYRHKLKPLLDALDETANDDLSELVYYIANSHSSYDGITSSYYLRYNDNKFSGQEERRRRADLLKKQADCGYSSDKPIYIGLATDREKKDLEPELSSYSSYLASHTFMLPKPDFAVNTIRNELKNLIGRTEFLDEYITLSRTSAEFLAELETEVNA